MAKRFRPRSRGRNRNNATDMTDRERATPLAGIRVLEFSHTVMGPTAGLIFAELGADVVKIEPAPGTASV
jgi:crotonobetainyl-CoA:carnitine CoA-transferase CaiB-like acyl-CoA transferase